MARSASLFATSQYSRHEGEDATLVASSQILTRVTKMKTPPLRIITDTFSINANADAYDAAVTLHLRKRMPDCGVEDASVMTSRIRTGADVRRRSAHDTYLYMTPFIKRLRDCRAKTP